MTVQASVPPAPPVRVASSTPTAAQRMRWGDRIYVRGEIEKHLAGKPILCDANVEQRPVGVLAFRTGIPTMYLSPVVQQLVRQSIIIERFSGRLCTGLFLVPVARRRAPRRAFEHSNDAQIRAALAAALGRYRFFSDRGVVMTQLFIEAEVKDDPVSKRVFKAAVADGLIICEHHEGALVGLRGSLGTEQPLWIPPLQRDGAHRSQFGGLSVDSEPLRPVMRPGRRVSTQVADDVPEPRPRPKRPTSTHSGSSFARRTTSLTVVPPIAEQIPPPVVVETEPLIEVVVSAPDPVPVILVAPEPVPEPDPEPEPEPEPVPDPAPEPVPVVIDLASKPAPEPKPAPARPTRSSLAPRPARKKAQQLPLKERIVARLLMGEIVTPGKPTAHSMLLTQLNQGSRIKTTMPELLKALVELRDAGTVYGGKTKLLGTDAYFELGALRS